MKIKAIFLQLALTAFSVLKGFAILKLTVELGDEQFAFLSQFLVMAAFFGQMALLNFDALVVSELALEKQKPDKIMRPLMLIWFFVSFFIAVSISIWSRELSITIWGGEQYFNYIPLFALYVVVLSFNLTSLIQFQGEKRFVNYSVYQFVQQFLQLLAVSIGVYFDNVYLLILILIIFEISISILGLRKIGLLFSGINEVRTALKWIKSNAISSLGLLISTLMIWILINGGRLVIVNESDLQTLAQYVATCSIAMLPGLFVNPICTIIFPYLSHEPNEAENAAEKGLLLVMVLGAIVAVILIFFAKQLLAFVAKQELYAGDWFVYTISIGQVIYGQSRLISLYAIAKQRSGVGFVAYSVGAFVFVVSSVFLIRPFGLTGVGVSFLFGNYVSYLYLINSLNVRFLVGFKFAKFNYLHVLLLLLLILSSAAVFVGSDTFLISSLAIFLIVGIYLFATIIFVAKRPIGALLVKEILNLRKICCG